MGEVTAPPLQSQCKHSSPAFPQGSFAFWEKCLSCTRRVTVPAYCGRNAVNVLVPPVPGCTTPFLKSCSGIFLGGAFKDALSSELLCRYCAQKLLTWKIDYRNKDIMK